jgi:hypothetical protein
LSKETDNEPIEVVVPGGDALSLGICQSEPEKTPLNSTDDFLKFVHLVFNDIENDIWEGGAETALTHGPLTDNVNEGFLKDDLAPGKIPEAKIRDWILGDLLP